MIAIQSKEAELIAEFRDIIPDAAQYDDVFLARFLKARGNDIQKASLMFNNYKKWRKDNDIDNISSFRYPEYNQVHAHYPRIWHKTCRIGRPVWIKSHANLSFEHLSSITTHERFVKHHIRENEKLANYRLAACSKFANKHIGQVVLIMDLKGFSLMEVARGLSLLKEISQIDADYYPEMLGKIIVINASMMFSTVWGMIKAILPKETVEKVSIVGENYQKELNALIDPENLPSYLGGTCDCSLHDHDIGPWNDSSTEGFPISEYEDYVNLDIQAEAN